MAETINSKNPKEIQKLIESGELKITERGFQYLKIN
jgi:hypothetical protein